MNRSYDIETNYPAKYCLVFVQIQSDNESALWQQIDEISNRNQFYFRHEHLFRGLCLENCKNLKPSADNSCLGRDNASLVNRVNAQEPYEKKKKINLSLL